MTTGMNRQIAIGSRVKTVKGTEGVVAEILEGGYLLENGKRVRTESIAMVICPHQKPSPRRILLGDRVRNRVTGEIGVLAVWWRDRSKAVIETGEGISDWISVKNLELVEVEDLWL